MREILFRGKLNQNTMNHRKGDWVYGLLTNQGIKWYISDSFGNPIAYEVIPETVGQYTGETDKNGNKIFEGDVLATPVDYLGAVMDVVKFKDGSFWRINGARDKPYLKGACLSKVIGNIHDNPELLDGVGNG